MEGQQGQAGRDCLQGRKQRGRSGQYGTGALGTCRHALGARERGQQWAVGQPSAQPIQTRIQMTSHAMRDHQTALPSRHQHSILYRST